MSVPDRFRTPRLVARRVTRDDLDYVAEVDMNPQMARWLSGSVGTRAESEARLERWLREERHSQLGFFLFFAADEAIGHGGIFHSTRQPGSVEFGYAVLPQYWGRGYGTEMARALFEIAKAHGVHNLIAMTRVTNERSRHVLEKLGFRYDGDVAVDELTYVRYVPRSGPI